MKILSVHSFFLLALCAFLSACAGQRSAQAPATTRSSTTQELVAAAKLAAEQAAATSDRSDKKDFARRGIAAANLCLERAPEEAGCYYYRAITTGLYYQAHIIGYQNGVEQMIADAHRVIALNPGYDHAGAYRLLGELYTQLPQTTVRADGITRDLRKAEANLREAVRIAPDYPENYLALAETLFAQGRMADALDALARAKELVPQWKNDRSNNNWKTAIAKLEQNIERKTR